MLNYIWLGLLLAGLLIGAINDLGHGVAEGGLKEAVEGAFNNAEGAVMKTALPLIGIMALWLGIMRLAEKSGLVQLLARLLRPLLRWLFPEVPAAHPAMGSMLMNMAANMLGLSNAATPLGLRAMKDLETLNPRPGTASNAMCTFMAINTSSIQLIPVTAVAILAAHKSTNPSSIIGTAFASTCIAAFCAVTAVKLLEKLPVFQLQPLSAEDLERRTVETIVEKAADPEVTLSPVTFGGQAMMFLYFLFFATLVSAWLIFPTHFRTLPFDLAKDGPVVRIVKTLSLISIPLVLTFFPLYAFVRGIKVYEEFVEGAKEGFQVILRIIPNLVAILAAIGFFRGAGGIALLTKALSPALNLVHFPPELLPMALIRPLSGSGSLGVFTDIVNTFGADDIRSRMAGTIYGSTETTFYVLAVYFGSVSIKRTRHAVPAGLVADFAGIVASICICKLVFQ